MSAIERLSPKSLKESPRASPKASSKASSSKSSSKTSIISQGESTFSEPKVFRKIKCKESKEEPVQIRIRIRKPKKCRSLERPICLRIREGRPIEKCCQIESWKSFSVAEPIYVNGRYNGCLPPFYAPHGYSIREPIYADSCVPNEPAATSSQPSLTNQTLLTSQPALTSQTGVTNQPALTDKPRSTIVTPQSGDEPLEINIGPCGDRPLCVNKPGCGLCDDRPTYKINFQDNVMNVTSNVDFLVKKLKRTMTLVERDPTARKFLIQPVSGSAPPVTITVRPQQGRAQTESAYSASASGSEEGSEEYLNQSADQGINLSNIGDYPQPQPGVIILPSSQKYSVQPQQQQPQYQQQQQPQAPQGYAQTQPQQQAQQPGQVPMQNSFNPNQPFNFTPEQVAAAFQEQQSRQPGNQSYNFTPQQIAEAFRQQQNDTPQQPQQSQQQYAQQPQQQYAQQPQQYAQPGRA